MSVSVVVLIAFAVFVAGGVTLEWTKAWREVRLAQAKRTLFGPGRSNDDD